MTSARIGRTATWMGIALLTVACGTPAAAALLTSAQATCQDTIAAESLRYLTEMVGLEQQCREKSLKIGSGPCPRPPQPGPLGGLMDRRRARHAARLESVIAERCAMSPDDVRALHFPGRCDDSNPLDGFTVADLTTCIEDGTVRLLHGYCVGGANDSEACSVVSDCPDQGPGTTCRSLLATEYDPTLLGPLTGVPRDCQIALAHASSAFMLSDLKAVHRCRRDMHRCEVDPDGTVQCVVMNILPSQCATHDPRTVAAIRAARVKAETIIGRECRDEAAVVALDACDPSQLTADAAATCEVDAHEAFAERFLALELPEAPTCGDGRLNQPSEECDGADDDACPGACGDPNGFFPCACMDRPRLRIIEHAGADLDLGWTGIAHDADFADGGGFLTDLWDCDGTVGPDTHCTIGPSCSLAPHSPCSPTPSQLVTGDAICDALGQGQCRTTPPGATGPHCAIDFKRRCNTDAQCPMAGDRCVAVPHDPPTPLSASGVSVCVTSMFSEDVVGTSDLTTGAGAVRLRERAFIHLGPSEAQPCPVCGGFCAGGGGPTNPGARTLCTTDDDCPGSRCVTEPVCSFGPRIDQPCRPNAPWGGATELFGNPSVDCPPPPGANLTGSGLELLLSPSTTGQTSFVANHECTDAEFRGSVCVGGTNDQRPCAAPPDCPAGSCREQCFCPGQAQPNGCDAACSGGANDGEPCGDDAACDPPDGFCHPGDCRVDLADTDSVQEGRCTVGPVIGTCSVSAFKSCWMDDHCRAPACPFCEPGETCTFHNRQCFVNGTVVRAGTPGVPDRTSAAVFCIPPTFSPAVDYWMGLPGPGALTQPETMLVTE